MKILVYPHDMAIGGSQINAIEIAARVAAQGHPTIVFGRPGPLVDKVTELGLEFVAAPDPRRRPSPAVMQSLKSVVVERGIDVMHGYEWPPALESWLAAGQLQRRVAAVGTVMSMAVAPFVPRTMPLVVGTEQIAEAERRRGRRLVTVIEPPVDLQQNTPDHHSGLLEFRHRWGVSPDELTVVTVTRLAHELKLEGLLTAIDTVPYLYGTRPIRLVIVGGGPARDEVAARAAEVNRATGRETVVLTGELADPRPAYQAADVLLGMGGSALRSLAFGKPLVVQGERGFWKLLTPESLDQFLWTGWYGVGGSSSEGSRALIRELGPVIDDAELRSSLGRFGRELIERRFGLDTAADRQLRVYRAALDRVPNLGPRSVDAARSSAHFARYVAGRRASKVVGRRKADDFNSKPVAGSDLSRPNGPPTERP